MFSVGLSGRGKILFQAPAIHGPALPSVPVKVAITVHSGLHCVETLSTGPSFVVDMAHLSLNDHDGSSGASDQDTLAPLLHPAEAPWPAAFPYQYPTAHSHADAAHSYSEAGGGSAGSQHSEGE